MKSTILFISAIIPVVVFLFFIYKKDSQKEPLKTVLKAFLWGSLSTIPVLLIEILINSFNNFNSAFLSSLYSAFFVAAFVEEGMKFLFLYVIIWKHKEFNQYYDGIVYAVFISLGFAMIENIGYVLSSGIATSIGRALLSVPAHGLWGVIMGYFFALARFSTTNKRGNLLWLSLLVPLFFHGLFDFLLMYMSQNGDNLALIFGLFVTFIIALIVLWSKGIKYIKLHYKTDIKKVEEDITNSIL